MWGGGSSPPPNFLLGGEISPPHPPPNVKSPSPNTARLFSLASLAVISCHLPDFNFVAQSEDPVLVCILPLAGWKNRPLSAGRYLEAAQRKNRVLNGNSTILTCFCSLSAKNLKFQPRNSATFDRFCCRAAQILRFQQGISTVFNGFQAAQRKG